MFSPTTGILSRMASGPSSVQRDSANEARRKWTPTPDDFEDLRAQPAAHKFLINALLRRGHLPGATLRFSSKLPSPAWTPQEIHFLRKSFRIYGNLIMEMSSPGHRGRAVKGQK